MTPKINMTKITNIEKNDINLSFKIIRDTQNNKQKNKKHQKVTEMPKYLKYCSEKPIN